MAKVLVLHTVTTAGITREERYDNNVAGRNLARDALRYHMGMVMNGDTRAMTMYATDDTVAPIAIEGSKPRLL